MPTFTPSFTSSLLLRAALITAAPVSAVCGQLLATDVPVRVLGCARTADGVGAPHQLQRDEDGAVPLVGLGAVWVLPEAEFDGAGLRALCAALADSGFDGRVSLALRGQAALADGDLSALERVPGLHALDVSGCGGLTDAALPHLHPLATLRWLRFDGSGITAAAVAADDDLAHLHSRAAAAEVAAICREQALVGLCAAVAVDGRVAWAQGFGFADRERGVAADPERTLFRWASVSKPVTAVVALQLAHEGRLDLDADVRSLVPEFPQKPWPITSRQLLCHQGGVVHYRNGKVVRTVREYDDPHPFADVVLALDFFKESPLVHEPGTAYAYTTHGYILLGAVVQRAGGEPFWHLVRKRVAAPLGMATFRPDYQWERIDGRARGYTKVLGAVVPSTDTDVSWKLPGGGFVSNVVDLARFGQALIGAELLPAEVRAAMFTAQRTRDGKRTGYGLGIGVGRRNGLRAVSHTGSQEKTRTHLLTLPDRQIVAAAMTNSEYAKLAPVVDVLTR